VAGSTNKKIVIRRFDRDPVPGFVNPQTYLQAAGIEVLTVSGSVLLVPYDEVKALYFVRDFDSGEPWASEHLLFLNRPKTSGVWVRMTFRDGEVMDGLMPNNLLNLEAYGFTLVPPYAGAGQQRIFVPRTALTGLQVVGVVGGPAKAKPKPKPKQQIELFE
jgi:hypothetical protein